MVNTEKLFPVKEPVYAFLKNKNNYPDNDAPLPGSNIEKIYTLLLIDDNVELAAFIVASLTDYKVIWAEGGAEGFQLAFKIIPDLIISDTLMPVMDGYECCKKIKENESTCHIPIILLTSKSYTADDIVKAAIKADGYLEKPFDIKELHLKVSTLLSRYSHQHKRVHKKLVDNGSLENSYDYFNKIAAEHPFLKKVCIAIEKKFEDSAFGVEELANQLSTNRTNLHRKLKALINLSPGDLIHKYRMWHAVKYLKQGYNSSETAYRTGFDSPSYFTKCFRKFYKLTPLEFLRQES